jgi:hypothetical protein
MSVVWGRGFAGYDHINKLDKPRFSKISQELGETLLCLIDNIL